MKFVSLPVEIEAVQWTGDNYDEIKAFAGGFVLKEVEKSDSQGFYEPTGRLLIQTLEGVMAAQQNDWIVRGLEEEFYPVKPSIMEKKYRRV